MPTDSAAIDLTRHFLIAMPGLEDDLFARSVVYVCEHSARGALGLIINKPSDLPLAGLFEKIALRLHRDDLTDAPVFRGGPIQTERGFVLHAPMGQGGESVYSSTLVIPGDGSGLKGVDWPNSEIHVALSVETDDDAAPSAPPDAPKYGPARLEMTTSKDVLEAMAEGAGPARVLVTLGYATWGKGQLESELAENAWLTVPADESIIFDTPPELRYSQAMGLLGLDAGMLHGEAGHA
jgi:putative transcriptional regulator